MKSRTQRSYDAVRRGHSRLATVTLHALGAGPLGEVPVYDGFVGFNLSNRSGARYGRLDVPGYEWFDLFDPTKVSWVTVDFEIEGETWSLGEFPVKSVEEEWPGGLVSVDLQDWAARRSRSTVRYETDLDKGADLAAFFAYYMAIVTPGGSFQVDTDDTNGAARPLSPRLPPGSDVWRAMVDVAADADAYLLVDSLTTGSVRQFSPYVPVHEDITGTVNRARAGWDMANIVNSVTVRLNSEDADGGTVTVHKDIGTGDLEYIRDGIGFCNLVETDTVPVATTAIANSKAQLLYDRRAGAVKAVSMRVVPQPWLEPGDVIFARLDGHNRIEQGVIDSIEYPLRSDQPMTITLRGIPVI